MQAKYDIDNPYSKGLAYFRNNDYVNARNWFSFSYKNSINKNEALFKLFQIDLREGNYAQVRKLLKENVQNQTIELKQIYGLLENIENNFEASKQYYNECMLNTKMQHKSLLAISKLYIQTGDYNIAEKMLENLQLESKFYIQSTIALVCLNILEHNYENAYYLLKGINENELTSKLKEQYQILKTYLLYFMGNLTKNDLGGFEKNYMIQRLFKNGDAFLLRHLRKHKNQKETNACFFKEVDLEKLLFIAREEIEKRNGNHFGISDMYRFRLEEPIGYNRNEVTSDLCVVTVIGTKDIITMYPVSLSDEFDKEGNSFSEELRLKRSRRENQND